MTIPVLPPYVGGSSPIANITPFTYRDGLSHLARLERLAKYINRVLIPFVQENYDELAETFIEQANQLVEQVNAALVAQTEYVDSQVELIINDSIQVQDPVVAGILADNESETRIALDPLIETQTSITVSTNLGDSETDIGEALDDAVSIKLPDSATVIGLALSKISQRVVNLGKLPGVSGNGVVDNTAAFQAALNTVGTGEHCIFFLPAGEWLTGPLKVKAHTVIQGVGAGTYGLDNFDGIRTSMLVLKPLSNAPLISDEGNATTDDLASAVQLRDICFDGNKLNQTVAAPLIHLLNYPGGTGFSGHDPIWKIERCYIRNGKGEGIRVGTGRRANKILNSEIMDNDGHGILIESSDDTVRGCIIGRNGGNGLHYTAGLQHIDGCDIFNNDTGIFIASGGPNYMITNCGIDINRENGLWGAVDQIMVIGCTFNTNGTAANATYCNIDFAFPNFTAQASTVIGCSMNHDPGITANKVEYGIKTNVVVQCLGLSWNLDAAPWTGAMTNNSPKVLTQMVPQGMRDGADMIMGQGGGGVRIGTSTAEKLAFWGATPITRPNGIAAAATDLASVITLANDMRAKGGFIGIWE